VLEFGRQRRGVQPDGGRLDRRVRTARLPGAHANLAEAGRGELRLSTGNEIYVRAQVARTYVNDVVTFLTQGP